MANEITEIIADLKEQILYLQELGVENMSVELPSIESPKFKVQTSKPETMRQKLERFVPDAPVVAPPLQESKLNAAQDKNSSARRGSILEQTKLSSRLQSSSNRPLISQNPISEQAKNKEMAKKQTIDEENPAGASLFGDISKTIPESNETLEEIRLDIGNCTRCPLWEGRTKIVHSEGNPNADLVFVGEAPGADEDASGRPFVGRAGQLLNKIIEAIGLKREDVFIGNINRCRPPQNRTPTLAEAHTCRPFLTREIAVVRPKIIIVLGNTATQNLLDTKVGITKLRGEFQDYFGVKVMPTFHPAYLLRDPSKKREVWEDMKKVRDELNKSK
ncbi:MAG: uracil-DNA glycosylase family protein [Pyrinomonadaceae bacterium]